jgi:hypothetical protein
MTPRIATERLDSGEARLTKIVELLGDSRFSIHDLSRVQSSAPEELARLNMPFELGIDYGFSVHSEGTANPKHLLVIAEDRHLYKAALSDIAGWDIRSHSGEPEEAIRQVRPWLQSHGVTQRPNGRIIGDYYGFQEWDYERLLHAGWDERDIQERETGELLEAMMAWRDAGRPLTLS